MLLDKLELMLNDPKYRGWSVYDLPIRGWEDGQVIEMHPNQNLLTLDIGIVEPHQNAEGKWRTQLVWSEVFRGQIKQ